jgi:hypothetical protein
VSVVSYLGDGLAIHMGVFGRGQIELTDISINNGPWHHVITIENGTTVAKDVRVRGSLPQGVGCLAFKNQNPTSWESYLKSVQSHASGFCELDKRGKGADERLQCVSVEEKDSAIPGNLNRCNIGLPVEMIIKVI